MNTIREYQKRFYNLLESTIGDVKPLINEEASKGYCLKRWKDTSTLTYKNCMFIGATPSNFGTMVNDRSNFQEKVYPLNPQNNNYKEGSRFYFKNPSGKKVIMEFAPTLETSGIPELILVTEGVNPQIKHILNYMVTNQFLNSSDITSATKVKTALYNLPVKKPSIAKYGSKGEVIVDMPAPEKKGELAPITNFLYWPKAHVYYYSELEPNYIFTDEGSIDSTFLDLIQNRD